MENRWGDANDTPALRDAYRVLLSQAELLSLDEMSSGDLINHMA